ncbi:hypothetical protein G7Y89_g3566 [Cudoniella acicularis]|uniref:Heterokaryon incompatibility domain-containing protein n=1 Tax=Cudoniella acicularis TaxID=354080 RepID=A0A8H4W530_9HELO|nr:hypothetical protein G7Y89_g3566 [Cudoniella acicularis]
MTYEARLEGRFYQNHAISKGSRDIRLLSLQPGHFTDPIKCEIQNANLDQESLEYETLSYVWGQSAIRSSILVEGQMIEVTRNVENAFRYLRKEDEAITLWVDALCINQRDKDPFEIFHHFASDKHLYELPGFRYNNDTKCYEFTSSPPINSQFHNQFWTGFHKVTQSPWWTRLWTIQEAVLPPKVHVLYGPFRTPWETFIRYYENSDYHYLSCCVQAFDALPQQLAGELATHKYQVTYISRGRKLSLRGLQPPFFREIVHAGSLNLASDPRDRVLGLLGLANPEIYGSFFPDYTLTPEKIYESAFRTMIHEYRGNPECFLGSWFGSGSSVSQKSTDNLQTGGQVSNLPSWVPNFATSIDRRRCKAERNRLQLYKLFYVSRDTKSKLSFGDNSTLHMSGQLVTTVGLVHDLPQNWRSTRDLIQQCLKSIESIKATLGCSGDLKAILRVILGELFYKLTTTWTDIVDIVEDEAFSFEALLQAGDSTQIRNFSECIVTAVCGQSFFVTGDGTKLMMGLCPLHTQAGDEVWIFYGGNVPFVLRPLTGENKEEGFYRFVGDCYLQDIMYGEAFDDNRDWSEENGRQIVIK